MGKTYGQFSVQNRQGRHFWSDINLAFSSNFDVQPHQNDQLVETTQTMPKVIFLPFSFWLLTVKNQKLNGRKGWVKIWPFFCSEASHRQHCAHGLKTAPKFWVHVQAITPIHSSKSRLQISERPEPPQWKWESVELRGTVQFTNLMKNN